MAKRWAGPIAFENQETGDDRMFAPGAVNFDALPVVLMRCDEALGAHDGAVKVGTIDTVQRMDDGSLYATGTFSDSEEGRAAADECARRMQEGLGYGVSVDLDDVSMELRVRSEVLAGMQGPMDPEDEPVEESPGAEDEAGRVTVASFNSGDFMTVVTAARLRGATLVDFPAFAGAAVALVADEASSEESPGNITQLAAENETLAAENSDLAVETVESPALSLVSSGYPVAPPDFWFENPAFVAETPLVITDEGRIYGHAAPWGTFHVGFAGQRIQAPRTATGYAYFRTGYIRTESGTDVPIGKITMGTGHAEGDLGWNDTLSHYDNTGTVIADVSCGEDAFGIWVAGALRPGVTDEQVRALRAAPLSGDWREIGGNLELVALLAVNTPGFMVPRMSALVASGEVRSLVASAAYGAPEGEDTVELTREEKLAIKEMVAKRPPTLPESLGVSDDTDLSTDTAPEQDLLASREARAAAATRLARAEQAKIRAMRNSGMRF